MIDNETTYKANGHIVLKANSLVDPEIVQSLYKASIAGVKVQLIIRGVCVLRPGIKGVSENITVHSIIGKYLEHPRIYVFKHDENECYISSADLMPRNLIRRIEILTPIQEPALQQKIKQLLTLQLQDNQLSWKLKSSGEYKQVKQGDNKVINNHEILEDYMTRIHDKSQKETPEYVTQLAKKVLKD
jgi:polyphosphate kinase